MTRSIRCCKLLLAATLCAGPARAETSSERVVTLQERPQGAVEELTEEMRVHLHRTHEPVGYQRIAAGETTQEQEQALLALEKDPPKILVLAGAPLLRLATRRPWPQTRLFFVSVPEHGLEPALREANVPGITDGCPLDGLLMLVRKMVPKARHLGWVHPAAEPVPGQAAATLEATAASLRFQLAHVAAPPDAAWTGALEKLDALLLLAPLLAPEAQEATIQGARAAKRPLFVCDRESVARGATAGLIVDPQQTGEAAGRAVANLLDGKPVSVERAEMGRIAIHRKSACESGAEVRQDLLSQALVFEKESICPPRAISPPRRTPVGFWLAIALGSLGASVAAAVMLRARGRLGRRKLPRRCRAGPEAATEHLQSGAMQNTLKLALPTARLSADQEAFFKVLSGRTRLDIQPIAIQTHAGLCAALEENAVQLLWAPPLVALDLWEWGSAEPLASVVRGGRTSYPAILVARSDGDENLREMKGARVAWVSRLSAAGYVVPARYLESEGLGGPAHFGEQQFFHTHQGVLHALLQGQADVGATYARFSRTGKTLEMPPGSEGLRVIASVGYVPNEVIMTSKAVSELERLSLGEALRRMTLGEIQLLGAPLGAERFSLHVRSHLEPLLRLTRRARQSEIPAPPLGMLPDLAF